MTKMKSLSLCVVLSLCHRFCETVFYWTLLKAVVFNGVNIMTVSIRCEVDRRSEASGFGKTCGGLSKLIYCFAKAKKKSATVCVNCRRLVKVMRQRSNSIGCCVSER